MTSGSSRVSFNLTPREALDFLKKLSSDDEFRSRLQQSPREVLAEHHIHFPTDYFPDAVTLPSKELLEEALRSFTTAGEINLSALPNSTTHWALFCFWWLFWTESRPPRPAEIQADDTIYETHGPAAAATRMSVNMTPRENFNFVLKLAADDNFRTQLQQNPSETLAAHHIYVPPHLLTHAEGLPTKEDLQKALSEMLHGRETTIADIPFDSTVAVFWYVSWFAFLSPPTDHKS